MLNLFIFASFYHVYTCLLLYEPLLNNTTVLGKGTRAQNQFELHRCEESFLSVKRESGKLSRNAGQLNNHFETTKIALIALQHQYNVIGKHDTIKACSISKYLVHIFRSILRYWGTYVLTIFMALVWQYMLISNLQSYFESMFLEVTYYIYIQVLRLKKKSLTSM